MSTRSLLLLGGLAASLACSAADDESGKDTAATTSTAAVPTTAAPHQVALSATEFALQAPDTVPAGWVTFRMTNEGQAIHYGHIVQLDSGRTQRDLLDGYLQAIRSSGARPTWVKRAGGPGGTAPGGTSNVTQYLEPGQYYWICPVEDEQGNPHFAKGEVKPFVVAGDGASAAARAAAPKATATIRLADHSFAPVEPIAAGRHLVRVENTGAHGHDINMMRLAPGMTIEHVSRALNPERARRPGERDDPPPPVERLGTLVGGIAVIASGAEAFFETELAPGEYALFCMTTAPDGKSHIEHGMIRQITVK